MVKCVNAESQSSHHDGRKCKWAVVENKKIVGGKTNSNPPLSTAILREGGVKIKKTYWPPVILYTGSFEPNHATDLLHETVDFKKTSRTSQPCWCTTSKQLWPKATQFFTSFGLV